MTDTTGNIEQRLRRLEDIEAIRALKGLYCLCVDGGWDRKTHDGDSFAQLFTEDAVMEFVTDPALGPPSRSEGREAIRRQINSAQTAFYAAHNMCGELIEIDGDSATATWHAMNYIGWPDKTFVSTFIYHERYVRTSSGWRIAGLRAVCRGIHPLANGAMLREG
jgi:ketosteroid isomerase-like protein